jgi:iron complex outermembrane receptor protein
LGTRGCFPNPEAGNEKINEGIYANAEIAIANKLSLNFGLRYSSDEISNFSFTNDPREIRNVDFDKTIGRAALEFAWTDNVMTYLSYSEGYKSGGLDARCTEIPTGPCVFPYLEENLNSAEIGIRSEWLDRRLRFNATYFDMNYSDMQTDILINHPVFPGQFLPLLSNVGDTEFNGVELDVSALVSDKWMVNLAVGTLDHKIVNLNTPSGAPIDPGTLTVHSLLPRAPELTYSGGVRFNQPMANGSSLSVQLDYAFKDSQKSYFSDANSAVLPAYHLTNVRLQYEGSTGSWGVGLFCSNCSDEKYFTGEFGTLPYWGSELSSFGRPRETGVDLFVRF